MIYSLAFSANASTQQKSIPPARLLSSIPVR